MQNPNGIIYALLPEYWFVYSKRFNRLRICTIFLQAKAAKSCENNTKQKRII